MKVFKLICICLLFHGIAIADENTRRISVVGDFCTSFDAQYAIIDSEIKVVDKKMDKSHIRVQQILSVLIQSLKKHGLSDEDITKSYVSQGPEYEYGVHEKNLIGYYSTCRVKLRVKDMTRLAVIYDQLSKFKKLTILNTGYGRNDIHEKRNEGFKMALQSAKEKAKLLAKTLDAEVGTVVRIKEPNFINLSMDDKAHVRSSLADSSRPADGKFGSVDISVTILVEFELI